MTDYNTIELEFKITGYYRLLETLTAHGSVAYYRGMFKDAIEEMLRIGTDYARSITHVKTGNLARAHTWEYDSHAMKGRIFINPRIVYATYSRLRFPWIYGPYEHARGGSHAFYARTYQEAQFQMSTQGLRILVNQIKVSFR